MISGFIMGLILYYFVQLDGGVANDILAMIGIGPVYWMETGLRSTLMVTLVNSWQYLGLCMVIYLAGLQNIPEMYLEAARIDGVNRLQEFFRIKLPMLMSSVTTAVITNLIGGFKLYEVIVSLSGGGPNRKSLSLSYYIQLLYFNDEKAGYASAVGIALFFIIFIISWPINKYLVSKVEEY
jgi:raffinose/stachyose/melibiose transport system permease protein